MATHTDTFDGRTETNTLGTASGGHTYTALASSIFDVGSGVATMNAVGTDLQMASPVLSTDQFAEMKIGPLSYTTGGYSVGPALCITDADNQYWTDLQSGNGVAYAVRLWRRAAGSQAQLATAVGVTYVPGAVLRIEKDGDTLNVWYNGVNVHADVVDAAPLTGTRAGIRGNSGHSTNVVSIDNFEFGDVAEDPEPPAPGDGSPGVVFTSFGFGFGF